MTHLGPMWLIHGDIISDTLAGGNYWDPHVYDALYPYLVDTVIDVGANVGALTLRFAKVAKRVIAFEPHPVLAACLFENARLSRGDVTTCSRGVYSKDVTLGCVPEAGHSPSSWTWLPIVEYTEADFSPAGPIDADDFTANDRVGAIKVDIQGADLHALMGMETIIKRDHPTIVFEFEQDLALRHGHVWLDYTDRMEEWGYKIERISHGCGGEKDGDYLALVKR